MFTYDFSRYYKIWFSTNPDVFLGLENELRLIRAREKNPNAILHLIYSETCLSAKAISDLKKFCVTYNIEPVAFEGIKPTIKDPHDLALFQNTLDELHHTRNRTGGNIAAAADNARLILPLIERYGIYSDFDVECTLSQLSPTYETMEPVLFPLEIRANLDYKFVYLTANSDFLAFSIKSRQDPMHLSEQAIQALRALQKKIISNYSRPFNELKIKIDLTKPYECSAPTFVTVYPEIASIMANFRALYSNPSIYDFRVFLTTILEGPKKGPENRTVKDYLQRQSVIGLAGPGAYYNLLTPNLPKNIKNVPTIVSLNDTELVHLARSFSGFSFRAYLDIKARIHSNNSIQGNIDATLAKNTDLLSDESWIMQVRLISYIVKIKCVRQLNVLAAPGIIFFKNQMLFTLFVKPYARTM